MTMSNPWAPQRREDPRQAFEPIQDRLMRKFPPRVTTGDARPIRGQAQMLPDGRTGGRPIEPPVRLMAPLANTAMPGGSLAFVNRDRSILQRRVAAGRYLDKPKITLLQLSKPTALDAANRVRYVPPMRDKPAPPVPWRGGIMRAIERNVDHPKSNAVSMQPVSTLGARWQMTQFPISSVPSSARATSPKTL